MSKLSAAIDYMYYIIYNMITEVFYYYIKKKCIFLRMDIPEVYTIFGTLN